MIEPVVHPSTHLAAPVSARPPRAPSPAPSLTVSHPPSARQSKPSGSTARGTGGAVSSVDVERQPDRARRAAPGAATRPTPRSRWRSALGVTEPYSAGHRRRRLLRLLRRQDRRGQHDRRPRDRPGRHHARRVHRPRDGQAVPVHAAARVVRRRGRRARHGRHLGRGARALRHPVALAACSRRRSCWRARDSPVDETFRNQTLDNAARFAAFPDTAKLFLPGGDAPKVGTTLPQPRPGPHPRRDRGDGTERVLRGPLAARDRRRRAEPAQGPGVDAARPRRHDDGRRPRRLPRHASRTPTHVALPRPRRLRHGAVVVGGTSVGEALNILETYDLVGGERAAAACTSTSRRRPARSPTAPRTWATRPSSTCRPRRCSARTSPTPASARSTPTAASLAGAGRQRSTRRAAPPSPRRQARHREHLDDAPLGRRQVGQRRGLHAHDRADRRFGHDGARPRLPAQQRADRLHRGLRPDDPNRIEPGQAPAVVDVADDRARRRHGEVRRRLAGRRDDHHDRAAGPDQPHRPRHDAARGRRRAPSIAAQHRDDAGRAGVHRGVRGRRSRRTASSSMPSGDQFTSAAEIGAAATIEVGADGS